VLSLARNSLARLSADVSGLVFGLIAGVLTARWLGPSGKGSLSALTFLGSLFLHACCVGLGDAAIVLVGQKRASLQEALSASVAVALVTATAGMAVFAAVCAVQFRSEWAAMSGAVLAASLSLPVGVLANISSRVLGAQERIVSTSAALFFTSGATTLGVWLFVSVLPLSVLGGVLAGLLGSAVGLAITASLLARDGLSFRPRWHGRYLAAALRYGSGVQLSHLLVLAASRVDLLLVYMLAGQEAAGHYSVALTLGGLPAMAPLALSHASFPRTANLDDREALALTARVFRCGMVAAVASGVGLAVVIPLLVPALFGPAYAPSVGPALILLAGGAVTGGQVLLCRATAARGRPALLSVSFGTSLAVMCALDFALIPAFGTYGAAAAAAAGPAAGLGVCLYAYATARSGALRLRDLVPTFADLALLAALPGRLVWGGRGRPSGPEPGVG
jgi:O-antigen/teichoic acid export membrane protein